MDDSVELIDLFSGVATSRDGNGYSNCLVSALPYTWYTLSYVIR